MALLIIFFIILILYLFRGRILVWLVQRGMRNMQEQARRQFEQQFGGFPNGASSEPPERKAGWDKPQPRKKKYAPTDGETVSFQEITVTETTTESSSADGYTRSTTSSIEIEQQIVDAEWEDL